jgi:hypothetical protein
MSTRDWDSKSVLTWVDAGSYQWSQTLTDVRIRIPIAATVRGKDVDYKLTATTLSVGLKGKPVVLKGDLFDGVVPGESLWTLETQDGVKYLEIALQKQKKHSSWDSVVKGGPVVDPITKEKLDKKMMLEKFQGEHAGFDFSGADFTGSLPEKPETFGDSWKNQ